MARCCHKADIESVFAVLVENVEVFRSKGYSNNTYFLYSYVVVQFFVHIPYYSSVGHCIVYFTSGIPQPSTDRRNHLHTFFL